MSTFVFPIGEPISNKRVKLIPFKPDLHTTTFVAQVSSHPEMFAHTPSGPFNTVDDLKALIERPDSVSMFSTSNPASLLFAIIDKTRASSPEDEEGELAGLTGYTDASKTNRSAEIYISMSALFKKIPATWFSYRIL